MEDFAASVRLRLLSYNIAAGASTRQYADYVTRGWQHVLPYPGRNAVISNIASTVRDYDIVGLQEADEGSLRSGFLNQTRFVAERGQFPYWSHQANRRVSRLACTCNALLTRLRPYRVEDHRLPGRMTGRGALIARFGDQPEGLVVANVHLALSRRARRSQLDFLADQIAGNPLLTVLGDFNADLSAPEMQRFASITGLLPAEAGRTFPSWRPARQLDHIFLSESIACNAATVLPLSFSDHCPVAVDVNVPRHALSVSAPAQAGAA
ncbi:MAG: endonuclease/exonuclease/phosphatase family protein [Pseudomonadota bacterium]